MIASMETIVAFGIVIPVLIVLFIFWLIRSKNKD